MYSTEINGVVTEFGTSGWLYRSNKLMYDRRTNTLWHQFLGEPVTAYLPEGDSGSAYASYRASDDTLLPVPERSELLPTESRVFGLTFNGQARAYPQEILDGQPVINDSLGGGGLVVVTSEGGGPRATSGVTENS